jgi:hypothetical protein
LLSLHPELRQDIELMSTRSVRAFAGYPETWILALLLVARLIAAGSLGLGRDEAAYWYSAWNGLAASYSPVTGVLIRGFTFLLGDGRLAIRLPGLLAGWASILLLISISRQLGAGRRAAVLAGLILAASPWQGYAATIVHPDSFLLVAVLLFSRSTIALARDPGHASRDLALLAAGAGLAALSKMIGALLFLPAAWLLWKHRQRPAAVAAGGGILAACGATLLLTTDLRVLSGILEFGQFDPNLGVAARISIVLAEITILAGPALIGLAAAGAFAAGRGKMPATQMVAATSALFVGFFAVFLMAGRAKGNWFLPAVAMLLPMGAVAWELAGRLRTTQALAAVSTVLSISLGFLWSLPSNGRAWAAVTGTPWLRAVNETYFDHTGGRERTVSTARSWRERLGEYHSAESLDARVEEAHAHGADAILSNDYGLAFQTAHRLGRNVRVHLPWDPVFARTCEPEPQSGEDVIFLSRSWEHPPPDWEQCFRETRRMPPPGEGDPPLHVVSCRGFSPRGGPQEIWTR